MQWTNEIVAGKSLRVTNRVIETRILIIKLSSGMHKKYVLIVIPNDHNHQL
jgi:hypothetical protein